ncbi:uncharacterized protein A4U43_C07F21090 [Asparagus officinalis]|uniref:Kinesin motor domain-containing protein n=1 Tax=Asparagus officinalis TaxID=4686 RepID=A0A5P1EH24_ASPOF|nr:kinesin-like protein KIN-10C isoform X2 [Asparagus officinalis]ONK64001.1 uncharacterized protein A4U43_C07F21090 [Asparagus officinalis]
METSRSKSSNSHRGVRIVGKIRPFLDSEVSKAPDGESSVSQISMSRTEGEFASVSFADQANGRKDSYKLDWCYGQEETTGDIFFREIKPLLEGILKGSNGCVIAYGAQGSGKTQLIQGSEENPGLALMAISEILPAVEELGGSMGISCYELCQDHIYDLLEPKEQEVLVMEDASRRIKLKGLSQVPIKSISEFKKSYFYGCNERKPLQKVTNDVAIRCHRGLIMHLSYVDKESNKLCMGKMNFVDLAGYEDTKRKNFAKPTLAEIVKVNKSLYALLNVVCALNSSETYIPYRETNLTRLLQDFLCKTSAAILFTCLKPMPCQDTMHAVCLASRSCQVVNRYRCDTTKSNKKDPRIVPLCSPINGRTGTLNASVKKPERSQLGSVERKGCGTSSVMKKRPQTLSNAQKKHETFWSEKKVSRVLSTTKERKTSGTKTSTINSEKEICVLGNQMESQFSKLEVNDPVEDDHTVLKSNDDRCSIPNGDVVPTNENCNPREGAVLDLATDFKLCNDTYDHKDLMKTNDDGPPIPNEVVSTANKNKDHKEDTVSGITTELNLYNDENKDDKEQTPFSDVGGPSPTITEKLREISNKLRLASVEPTGANTPTITEKLREISNSLKLASEKPIDASTPIDRPCKGHMNMESMEPKTPRAPVYLRLEGGCRYEELNTPQDILQARSTGLKKSLVQECLSFLNSASKEELKELKGIGEKRASYIIELREETPEPFKEMDDLKDLGLSSKQIRGMMSKILGDF